VRVFLVHVRDPQFYAIPREEHQSRQGRKRVMGFPPIGIMSLSSVLKRAGHECVMFDQANPDTPDEVILEEIKRQKPEMIGLSFLSTTSFPHAKVLARQIRAQDSGIKIAFGGVFVTLNASQVKKQCPEVDFICRGDGEELLLELLDGIDDPESVGGLTWAEPDGTVRHNPNRTILRDLDQWPFPDRESLELDYIESMPLDVPAALSLERFCTMQTSRGCPFPCVYCDIPALSDGKWRCRSPEHVLGEMQQLSDEGYRSIYLTDDHFLLKRKRIREISQGIIDRDLKFGWGCEGRVDSVAKDQFPLMAQANCNFLAFGVESGSQKVLDRLKKMQTLEQIEVAVDAAKRSGIERAHGFFLVGSPDESEQEILQSFRFAANLKLDTFGFNRLCVYRGTPLWHEYVQRGIIDDERDWSKWFKCSDIDPTILPSEVVNRARQKGYVRLFAHRAFVRPIQTFKLLRAFSRHMKKRDILALLWSPFRKRELTRAPDLPATFIDLGMTAPERETKAA